MATTTTRGKRGDRPRTMLAFLAVIAVSAAGLLAVPAADAQVKAPSKSQLKAQHARARAPTAKPSPTDNQAEQLNEKWLNEFKKENAEKRATAVPAAAAAAARPAAP